MNSLKPVLLLETPPAALPIEVADIKSHLRIDHSDDDGLLGLYLNAAIALVDGPTGRIKRCLVTQQWRQTQPCPNGAGVIWIELPPVTALVAVEYIDSTGTKQSATVGDFELIEQGDGFAIVRPKSGNSWPAYNTDYPNALQVVFSTGYADAASVPEPIKSALRLIVGDLYANREASSEWRLRPVPFGVDALLEQYRSKWYA